MKKFLFVLFSIAFLFLGASQVSAYSIAWDPVTNYNNTTTDPLLLAMGDETSQSVIDTLIAPYLGGLALQYKHEEVNSVWVDVGPLWDSYDTDRSAGGSGSGDYWNISYQGGSYLPGAYLLIKDGNQDRYADIYSWYFFKLIGWNGTDTINIENFWPDQGGISHIALYGLPVNEPATMLLLGSGLVCVVSIRRKFKK